MFRLHVYELTVISEGGGDDGTVPDSVSTFVSMKPLDYWWNQVSQNRIFSLPDYKHNINCTIKNLKVSNYPLVTEKCIASIYSGDLGC